MYKKLLPLTEEPIKLSELKNPKEDFKNYKRNQKFFYTCDICKKQVIVMRVYWNETFLCSACKTKQTNLEKYGVTCSFKDKNKIKKALLEKYGVTNPNYIDGVSEKIKKTKKHKYGEHLENVVEKYKDTSLERYGIENAGNSKEAREKAKQTCRERYGTDNPAKSEIVKQHARENNIKKYNKPYVTQVEEFKQKAKETFRKNNSRENFGTEKFKAKIKEKYNVENPSQSETVKQKKIETALEHFGVSNPFKSEIVKQKIRKTLQQKYGVDHPLQNPDIFKKVRSRYLFEDEFFDSSWELAVWIWAKETGKVIKRSPCSFKYEYAGKVHKYFPDFKIDEALIEIKGDQFLDKFGNLINPFDPNQNELCKEKQKCMKEHNVKVWTQIKLIPIFKFVENIYGKNFWRQYECTKV